VNEQLVLPGAFSETGLALQTGLTFDEWAEVGALLGRIGRAHQWWVGDWLNYGERAYGEKYAQAMEATRLEYGTVANAAYVAGRIELSRRRENLSWSHHYEVAALDPPEQDEWLDRAEAKRWNRDEMRRAVREPKLLAAPAPPEGVYSTIVIDPPWPMQKIEREVRPNQVVHLDYRPMGAAELREFVIPAADDAHLYLWTTHKFLPLALELADTWGFRYECLLTWTKNVGFTPFSFMYSTEHVLFCRRGGLDLLAKGRRLDFQARVREHSRKPDEFYELVRDVSPGPRIDMFSREAREGFVQWGNEPERFADAA
jgi:N6-adenosine-specific RNA methylase IME4